MSVNAGFMTLILGVILIGIFALGTNLYINMNSAIDENSNVSSDYTDVYNTTTDINVQTITIVQYVPMIIAAMVLVFALMAMKKHLK